MTRRILLATRSEGKLRELRPMFAEHGYDVLDLREAGLEEDAAAEEGVERYDTFEENAAAKARYFFERAGHALPVVADDSGLEVTALGGRPGVRSKRFSGRDDLRGRALDEANNARLLAGMTGQGERSARYVCVAAYVDGDVELIVRGETAGEIVDVPRGEGGFGYDPYFLSHELGVTFGEATREAKQQVSHRGRAFAALLARLRES